MPEPSPLTRIAVVGGGTVALLATLALARALPSTTVVLVPCAVPDEALADHAVSGGAALQRLHARIGIGDPLLFARAGATRWLATRYRGFGRKGDFFVGHGAAARDPAGGFAPEPSLAALLAEQERCLLPEQEGSEGLDVLLRFDPEAYQAGLRALARQAGVQTQLPVAMGEPGLLSGNANVVDADLIVDATGTGWLRAQAADSSWLDWSGGAQLRRLCRSSASPARRASLSDTVSRVAAGYRIEQPGSLRTAWTALWAEAEDDEHMQRALADVSGATVTGPVAFRPGRLAQPWQGRVVALGDAAVRLAPLGGLNLHVAAAQILLLLDLLPGGAAPFVERVEYNRRAALLADHAQDYVLCQQGQQGSPLLAQRIDQFGRRGWLPDLVEGCVPVDHWAQLLLGLGVTPGELPRLQARNAGDVASAARARQEQRWTMVATAKPYGV